MRGRVVLKLLLLSHTRLLLFHSRCRKLRRRFLDWSLCLVSFWHGWARTGIPTWRACSRSHYAQTSASGVRLFNPGHRRHMLKGMGFFNCHGTVQLQAALFCLPFVFHRSRSLEACALAQQRGQPRKVCLSSFLTSCLKSPGGGGVCLRVEARGKPMTSAFCSVFSSV